MWRQHLLDHILSHSEVLCRTLFSYSPTQNPGRLNHCCKRSPNSSSHLLLLLAAGSCGGCSRKPPLLLLQLHLDCG
jgi:hypothetical protein